MVEHSHTGLVTNEDSHDHNGGDGVHINYTTLTNIGTYSHAQIDTALGSSAAHLAAASPHSGHYLSGDTLTAAILRVNGGSPSGAASTVSIVNATAGVSSGKYGSITMSSGATVTQAGWLRIYIGTAAVYIPYWTGT